MPEQEDPLPANYSIDVARKIVISNAWGVMTDADVREHRKALRSDPLFDPTYRELVDMSGISLDMVDISTKQEISRDQIFAPGVRRAWVARDDQPFGMAQTFAIAAEKQGSGVQVFRSRKEAEEWLGL